MNLIKFGLETSLYTRSTNYNIIKRYASAGCISFESNNRTLTVDIKHRIESYWHSKLGCNRFELSTTKPKFYVLSMFPYPSGRIHMGHVRVYTISDAMARFYRMNGYNVLHPMGWDAFGLPAENAALEHNIPADKWTMNNIEQMREQFNRLGLSFDWSREVTTCNPDYYRWTQSLFLKMFHSGLAYQKEALVNWDPVDQTVLADEQVDENQCSWRSGAKIERKLLKQWFIQTTKYAKALFEGLDDPALQDWRDIINLQRNWIGECNGYNFDLKLNYVNGSPEKSLKTITLWTQCPEYLTQIAFIAIAKDHPLNMLLDYQNRQNISAINPFDDNNLVPIITTDAVEFPPNCDAYLGIPSVNELDVDICQNFGIYFKRIDAPTKKHRCSVISLANKLNIGGYLVSSKLKDWLISRQRYWGTPIPIIHCEQCGAVPVPEADLPVYLPQPPNNCTNIECPKCGSKHVYRERDTMDTFVDSSWYFLRYLDPHNTNEIFDAKTIAAGMPVDLYIGGKEHAVLHMYYARFVNHFLHSIGLSSQPEPFCRLLIQGMVMGQSRRVRQTGKYLHEHEARVIDEKKNEVEEIQTGKAVDLQWEKMSKSKRNGVDPNSVIEELSTDTVRLIMLGDVAPTSHRNWSRKTFPGFLNWQNRIWLTIHDFYKIRIETDDPSEVYQNADFLELEQKMCNTRNYYITGTTFNYKYSHQLSVAISKMQGLTNSIRKASKPFIKYGKEYELAVANLLIMLSPIAPHFTSELWSQFLAIPNRVNDVDGGGLINWNLDVLEQRWPVVDRDYQLDLQFKVNGKDADARKLTTAELSQITADQAFTMAMENTNVCQLIRNKSIERTHYVHYPGCKATLSLFFEGQETKRNAKKQ